MSWNDYKAVWERQRLPVGDCTNVAKLKETFETKRRKMAATLVTRDCAEACSGLAVSLVFACLWWQQGKAGWPLSVAVALVLGVTGLFVQERIRAHRNRLEADAPLLAKLQADIVELQHQRHLLLSLWTWYLTPISVAILIVLATTVCNAPPQTVAGHRLALAAGFSAYLTLVGALFWFVSWLNRRVVRHQIEPRLVELEALRRDLFSSIP